MIRARAWSAAVAGILLLAGCASSGRVSTTVAAAPPTSSAAAAITTTSPAFVTATLPAVPYQPIVAPPARDVYVLVDVPQTLTWPGFTPGVVAECQISDDGITWSVLASGLVDTDGIARCSFTPKRTAYYRSYSPDTDEFGETVRGVVTEAGAWSGYVVGPGPYRLVTGTFGVPGLVPSAVRTDTAIWVGIGGYVGSEPLIQAGIWETYDPSAAQPFSSYAWWEIVPSLPVQPLALPVAPGDTVTVTIQQARGSRWSIVVANDTTGWQTNPIETSFDGSASTAEWIVEQAVSAVTGAQLRLGQFAPEVRFTRLGFIGSQTVTWPMAIVTDPGGVPVTMPSALSSDGRSFSVVYGSSSPPAP